MSFNWADLAVILIIAISAYLEYKRGFLLSVFKTASFIIAIFLGWVLQPFASEILKKSFVYDWISNSVAQSVFKEGITGETISKAQQISFIDNLKVPTFIKEILKKSDILNNSDILNLDVFKKYIVEFMSNIFIGILAIILVFVIVMIVMKLLSGIIKIISSIPLLKEINELFGAGLGVIIGLLEVWISYMVIIFLFSTNPSFNFVFDEINKSILAKFLYENNLITYLLTGIFK